ncbi:hypothetical protein, partial [Klebsiella pneumoniae]|uniref:hypothetical protein n=1 Tax=Klebsiella pneumoniae TaxID=573 RepID=UPI00210CCB7E
REDVWEPPNPLVNELIIMPDIEKRLEAFVRIAHVSAGRAGELQAIFFPFARQAREQVFGEARQQTLLRDLSVSHSDRRPSHRDAAARRAGSAGR